MKKLIALTLTIALLITAFVQLTGGSTGSRDMSGDTHIRSSQPR